MKEERFAWFVGIDWGSERHHACLVDSEGTIIAEREFSHSGTGLAELADWPISDHGRGKRSRCRDRSATWPCRRYAS